MALANGTNGDTDSKKESGLGQDFTNLVNESMGPKTNPRLKDIMTSFTQHIHDFAREVNLTTEEWMMGVQMINEAGRLSSEKRNEGQLLCDIIGLESLVDDITYRAAIDAGIPVTSTAILGPFWRSDAPFRENGSTITFDTPADGQVALMYGKVYCATTGKPLHNAVVDVWQASTNGLYEQQDSAQRDCNLRGKFITDAAGSYSFYCLRPTPYPIPNDGPAGKLLSLLDRHPWRPAHIHLIVEAQGYKSLTTQIFDKDSNYLEDDSVFAVKDGLTVRFKKRDQDPNAPLELEYNIYLSKDD